MDQRKKSVPALALAVCLLVSACGGRTVPPPSESPSWLPAAPQPVATEGEAPSPSSSPAESSREEEAPSSAPSESSAPEETSKESSSSLPPEEASSSSQPEPPESRPETVEPPSQPEQDPGLEPPLEPEPPPEEEPQPLPDGCRWLNITEASLLGFINRERSKEGLTPLTFDSDLAAAARLRAVEMLRGNYVRHTRPGGEPWETVLEEIPVEYVRAGENLAWCNHGVGEEVGAFQWFSMWRESSSHREAMLDPQYTSCGIAVLTGPYYDGEDQSYAVAIFCTY